MTCTTLHRALGILAGPVTEQMLIDAVTAKVGEAEDLDRKEAVDDGRDSAKEFGKDVAAMANTAGGVIIYGVREDGAGHAAEVVGITNPNPLVQSMRGKAGMIRPFVPALRVQAVPLDQPGRAGDHVIVVEIPRSPDAPTSYRSRGKRGVCPGGGAATPTGWARATWKPRTPAGSPAGAPQTTTWRTSPDSCWNTFT
ncbi:helix-turn-helix domain-containing protein [Kitasatospora purpeofusca]|uniref:AlbA family DNA-binding domain-containing protein n=1 Tax=Kitasatospora purpeofusca TaxID=67352 RepID=UPI0035DF86C5